MTQNKQDLTQGAVFRALLRLALPLMGTQFMTMLYNLTDMFWLGRVGGDAVAASGTGGLFMWLSVGLLLIGKVGAEIGVSQARGRGEPDAAYRYARAALTVAAALGVLYGAFLFFLRRPLVGFFNYAEARVAADARAYLGIVALGMPFTYITGAVTGIFNASGNTRAPFLFSLVGVALNVALDPLLILALDYGVAGAAAASVAAQAAVACLCLRAVRVGRNRPFEHFRFTEGLFPAPRASDSGRETRGVSKRVDEVRGHAGIIHSLSSRCALSLSDLLEPARQIFRWMIPTCLENSLFCLLTMITSRFEVSFGAHALAMSRVGSQVESLTWLVGAGFGSALTSYVGQNFGAGKYDRIRKGVRYAVFFMTGWGVMVTAVLFFGGGLAFSLFLPDPALRQSGVIYMQILAACQVPMCWEAVAANAFRGKGRTVPPSVSRIVSCVIRVPLAYALSRTALGLYGIWTAVSFSALLCGVWISLWYWRAYRTGDAAAASPRQG